MVGPARCSAAMDDYIIYSEIGTGSDSVVYKGRLSVRHPIYCSSLAHSLGCVRTLPMHNHGVVHEHEPLTSSWPSSLPHLLYVSLLSCAISVRCSPRCRLQFIAATCFRTREEKVNTEQLFQALSECALVDLNADAVWRSVPLMTNIPVVSLLSTPGRQR